MFLKICGIQTYAEAAEALDCGATALGFLVGLTHLAEDGIDEVAARDIVRRLPAATETVMVTHLLDAGQIAALAGFIGVRTVQIHDALAVPEVARLGSLLPGVRLLKAIHIPGPDVVGQARAHAAVAHGLLLDTRTRERLGGTGRTHDWSISRAVVSALAPLPVYLAGGLDPDNVEGAIEQVRPAGVDVNSGVEDAGGRKDRARMRAFLRRAADRLGTLDPAGQRAGQWGGQWAGQ